MHSTLFPGSNRSVEPVVDEKYALVAHYGWFRESQVLIPKGLPKQMLYRHLAEGYPAFADKLNPMPAFYESAYTGAPEAKYLLLTDLEGKVLSVHATHWGEGAVSTTPPWEYIMLGKALIVLARGGDRLAVKRHVL